MAMLTSAGSEDGLVYSNQPEEDEEYVCLPNQGSTEQKEEEEEEEGDEEEEEEEEEYVCPASDGTTEEQDEEEMDEEQQVLWEGSLQSSLQTRAHFLPFLLVLTRLCCSVALLS